MLIVANRTVVRFVVLSSFGHCHVTSTDGHPQTGFAKQISSSPLLRQSVVHSTVIQRYHPRVTMYNSESIESLSVKPAATHSEIREAYLLKFQRLLHQSGPDSSVGTATRYWLDGPGIESRWGGGEIYFTRPDRPWGPLSFLYNA